MTEFISRKYGKDGYEIIIKTDSYEHYRSTEDFARRLIDHSKPATNADRIRAMSDEELADFIDRCEMNDIDYAKTFCDLRNGQYDCDQYVEIGNCEKCKWKGRHQKCSCCRRNRYIKDCYETEWNKGG